jgi:hypothetical protein
MLLYPAAGIELREKFRVQGHDVTVATVDLAKAWQEVKSQLPEFLR